MVICNRKSLKFSSVQKKIKILKFSSFLSARTNFKELLWQFYFVFAKMKTNSRDSNAHPFFEAAVFSARR